MTRSTNARIAGIAFLLYIVVGIGSMIVMARVPEGKGIADTLAGYAAHAPEVRLSCVLTMIMAFCALALAATLYAITRDEDPDLAMFGLTCRVAEGVVNGLAVQGSLGLLWLATTTGADVSDAGARNLLAAFLYGQSSNPITSGTFFAVGSLLFSWLLLRGRMIPVWLAWLGVIASVLLVIGLPLRLAGVLSSSQAGFLWLPMAAFEIPLALWFLFKGVAPPRGRAA